MGRFILALFIAIHGLIHMMGFTKAFGFTSSNQITKDISKPIGILWLVATIVLITTACLYVFKKDYWWMLALSSIILSQVVIILYWQDARFGTVANIIILAIACFVAAEWRFENQYQRDVLQNLNERVSDSILTRESIEQLPEPVQHYLIYSGAINNPKITNFKIKFKGQIRKDGQSEWMPFTTEQYNFIDPPTRLFFMKATMKHLPVSGYHRYENGTAMMDIRLMSLFNVQNQSGREMDISETVTWFNDLCLYAPGALVDNRITWEAIDPLTSKATFSHRDITISATLYFEDSGALINFMSNDRYRFISNENNQAARFSTPIKNYFNINEHLVPSFGEAVWNLPEGDLTYGQFHCLDIQYNVKD